MLYATNIDDLATPVNPVAKTSIKRKAPATPPATGPASISEAVDEAMDEVPAHISKEKKIIAARAALKSALATPGETDAKEAKAAAQKAARAQKARQVRAAKKAAAAEPVVPRTPPPAPKKPKAVAKGKGKAPSTAPSSVPSTPTPAPKKRKAPVQLDVSEKVPKMADASDDPPAWFKSFMANTRVEEAKISQPKKAQRTVRKEAAVEAGQKWREPEVRERINHQQDQHMASMHKLYSQIFRR